MKKVLLAILILALAGLATVHAWIAQQPQVPEKYQFVLELFQTIDTWPTHTPGTIAAKAGELKPLRAVYERLIGLDTDSPQKIRAVWTVDQVLWNGEPVTEVGWFSTGGKPISSIGYLDPETSALRFRHVTSPTKSTITVVHTDKVVDTSAEIGGEAETSTLPLETPAFDRYAIGHALAGMQLEEGLAFKIKGVYPGRKSIAEYPVVVGKRETITDVKGHKHEVWPVLLPYSDGWFGHYYVDKRAPYFFGFDYKNILTEKVSMSVRLVEVQDLP